MAEILTEEQVKTVVNLWEQIEAVSEANLQRRQAVQKLMAELGQLRPGQRHPGRTQDVLGAITPVDVIAEVLSRFLAGKITTEQQQHVSEIGVLTTAATEKAERLGVIISELTNLFGGDNFTRFVEHIAMQLRPHLDTCNIEIALGRRGTFPFGRLKLSPKSKGVGFRDPRYVLVFPPMINSFYLYPGAEPAVHTSAIPYKVSMNLLVCAKEVPLVTEYFPYERKDVEIIRKYWRNKVAEAKFVADRINAFLVYPPSQWDHAR